MRAPRERRLDGLVRAEEEYHPFDTVRPNIAAHWHEVNWTADAALVIP